MDIQGPDETDAVADAVADDSPAAVEEAPVVEPPDTGNPDVDAALAGLRSAVRDKPLEDQIAAFEAVHQTLQTRLSDVES